MGVQPILPVKVSITINIMLNFDSKFNGHGDANVTCEQTLNGSHTVCAVSSLIPRQHNVLVFAGS